MEEAFFSSPLYYHMLFVAKRKHHKYNVVMRKVKRRNEGNYE